MSTSNLSRDDADFRAAAGLASWSPAALDLVPDAAQAPRGPGLFEVIQANGRRAVTNVRRLAGAERTPGSRLILSATLMLAALAAGLYVVSLQAQYRYVFTVKHESAVSVIEAVALDAGMTIFALLALGLAMAGQSARIERAAVVACALASAGMNYAAASVASPRSVVAFVMPPIFLALAVDRVVAVVRRHVMGDAERSAWSALGRLAAFLGMAALYVLRFVLAPPSTAEGLRRQVLIMTPLPAAEIPVAKVLEIDPPDDEIKEPAELVGATKRERLAWWYERDVAYGDRPAVAAAAKRIAPRVGLGEGTARAYIGRIVAELEQTRKAS
jgi:hypothetical protein